MNWARRVLISLGVLFFAACCGVVLLFDWPALGWKALSVQTGSMRPSIKPGSLVLVHSVPVSSLKNGDVITYTNLLKPGSTVTHRIVKSYKLDGKIPTFITKGDANSTADRPVASGLVQGRAVLHVPYIGSFLTWGKGIVGLFILVYIPAVFMLTEEVQRLSEYYRRSRPYFLLGFQPLEKSKGFLAKLFASTKYAAIFTVVLVAIGGPVRALLTSNTVTLGPNRITTAPITPPTCTSNSTSTIINSGGSGSNNVVVNNSSSQSSSSGNVNVGGNTNVGNVSTGNASNTNCTTTIITQTNH